MKQTHSNQDNLQTILIGWTSEKMSLKFLGTFWAFNIFCEKSATKARASCSYRTLKCNGTLIEVHVFTYLVVIGIIWATSLQPLGTNIKKHCSRGKALAQCCGRFQQFSWYPLYLFHMFFCMDMFVSCSWHKHLVWMIIQKKTRFTDIKLLHVFFAPSFAVKTETFFKTPTCFKTLTY